MLSCSYAAVDSTTAFKFKKISDFLLFKGSWDLQKFRNLIPLKLSSYTISSYILMYKAIKNDGSIKNIFVKTCNYNMQTRKIFSELEISKCTIECNAIVKLTNFLSSTSILFTITINQGSK